MGGRRQVALAAVLTREEARTFADQAVAALRDAIKAGWNWPDELKEPGFDALRHQDDFKKLLVELTGGQVRALHPLIDVRDVFQGMPETGIEGIWG